MDIAKRELGRTGLQVTTLGYGAMELRGAPRARDISEAQAKDKTAVWRWQERFMHEGVAGLTRDKTRPSRIPPLPAETVDRVVALTTQAPPYEATHWSAPAMAKAVEDQPVLGAAHLGGTRTSAASGAHVQDF